jgi:hypothetical protein
MQRKELNQRSPLRVLEQSIHGGLGAGHVGVVVARRGIGKTAFLVGVALDDLLRGHKVLHVSLSHPVEKVRAFYDEIFADLAHTRELIDVWKVRQDMERHRRIHCHLNGRFNAGNLRQALEFLGGTGDFRPAAIVIDDYDFASATAADLQGLREVAGEIEVEIWMSASTTRTASSDDRGIPEPVAHVSQAVDVVLRMAHDGKNVHISLLKDHDNPKVSELKLALDPTTLLLVRE